MKNYIVRTYSSSCSLEEALNEMSDKYFPLKIFDNKGQFTVVYCKKDIMNKISIFAYDNRN